MPHRIGFHSSTRRGRGGDATHPHAGKAVVPVA
jgi:hypothetical protein